MEDRDEESYRALNWNEECGVSHTEVCSEWLFEGNKYMKDNDDWWFESS